MNPVCGTLELRATDVSQPGAAIFRQAYYGLIRQMWNGSVNAVGGDGRLLQDAGGNQVTIDIDPYAQYWVKESMPTLDLPEGAGDDPTAEWRDLWELYMRAVMGDDVNNGVILAARQAQLTSESWRVAEEAEGLGWAGAGIWYNTIAEQNGALVAAIRNLPTPLLHPRIMQQIEDANRKEDETATAEDRFKLDISREGAPIIIQPYEKEIGLALSKAYEYWLQNPESSETGNIFLDMINTILGTSGLFEICRNTDIHPLAQLATIGKSMLDSSISAFAVSAGMKIFSIQPALRSTLDALASMFTSVAGVGILVGFILFYVLPFMPFIYFFFAVAGWVKTIFEALVAAPLWCLAHLRIDSEGIVGEAAIKGYFLVFEIFIRPILIIFGLIASIVIFAVMVKALNQIFFLILNNSMGYDGTDSAQCFQEAGDLVVEERDQEGKDQAMRGPLDEFFFTILYAIIVYIIGTSCFKLIDAIPSQIMRWIDADVATFSDNAEDSAAGLMKYATLGGSQFGSQLGGSIGGLGDGLVKQAQVGVDNV